MTSSYDKTALMNALLGKPTALPEPQLQRAIGLGSLYSPSPPPVPSVRGSLANLFTGLGQQSQPNLWGGLSSPTSVVAPGLGQVKSAPAIVPASTKRKGFFSFHYDDIMRVNNVRNVWKISCPGRENKRQFYDRSLWESVQRKNPEGLKSLIRGGMEHASVVCVLVGTNTWARPWVRYEIARSVIDKKGLLAVHINGLPHHQRRFADAQGENPLNHIGIGCSKLGVLHLYEKVQRQVVQYGQLSWEWQWIRYSEFTQAVPLPKYMKAPSEGCVQPLSGVTPIYDYVTQEGYKNIGKWIDYAALRVGR